MLLTTSGGSSFAVALANEQATERFVAGFSRNILRPNNTFTYAPAGSPSADTVC